MKDLLGKIIKYEKGKMSEEEIIESFQVLINTGDAWKLQEHYERMAKALIGAGLCEEVYLK